MSQVSIELSVPASHPALPGHFPGQPIVPGVVLLALVHEQACQQLGFAPGATRWSRVKFLRPILPEQVFRLTVDGRHEQFRFRIETSTGEPVAQGQCRHAELA